MNHLIFDTHAHYNDDAFAEDRDEVLSGLRAHGIGAVVNICSDLESIGETLELMEKYPWIYGAAGIHPTDTAPLNEENFKTVIEALKHPKMLAVGEIGLDYYWDEPEREIQKRWFERQLELAREVKKPVSIHSRDAAQDTLDLMKAHHSEEIGGVIHCFSYGTEMAREYLNMGLAIGIGGVVTFKNARKLKEVAEYVPLESILLETDSPYLAPVPYRGKRNSALYIPYIAEEIARIKNISVDEVLEVTRENAYRVFPKSR